MTTANSCWVLTIHQALSPWLGKHDQRQTQPLSQRASVLVTGGGDGVVLSAVGQTNEGLVTGDGHFRQGREGSLASRRMARRETERSSGWRKPEETRSKVNHKKWQDPVYLNHVRSFALTSS
jgi:hypothetical protein